MQRGVIIGCGAMGKCHGEAYKSVDHATIIAVVDMNQEKGESLAAQLNCTWVRQIEEIESEQIDFVDICLPTHLHLPMIRKASEFTHNIICEKPLAVREEEVKEIPSIEGYEGEVLFSGDANYHILEAGAGV